MTLFRTAKMIKIHHECQKYPKTIKNNQNALKTTTIPKKTFKMTKIPLKPQKLAKYHQNLQKWPKWTKLSQNTLDFLDLWGMLVSLECIVSSKNLFYLWEIPKYQKTYKYTKTSKMIRLELLKWLKCTTNVENILKPFKMNKTPPKWAQ